MSSKRLRRTFRGDLAAKLAAERKGKGKPLGMAAVLEQLDRYGKTQTPATQTNLAEGGARPNIMAPSKYMVPPSASALPLMRGIDSIWLNFSGGSVREDVLELLAWAKEEAQTADGRRADSPLPPFDGAVPQMLASGLPYYEWHLSSRDLDVRIRKPSKRSPRPVVVVRVSAECLWRMGYGGKRATLAAAEWLRPIFDGGEYTVKLSKVHIATDFQGYVPTYADVEDSITRVAAEDYGDRGRESSATDDFADYDDDEHSGLTVYRSRGRHFTGLAAGKSNNIRLNLYDKRAQVKKKRLDWVPDLWERCAAYDPAAPVWRAEYQFGRGFLHARGIETLDDLWLHLPALWAYGMGWFSFRTPTADTNSSRWPVAPWWADLSSWQLTDNGVLPKIKQVRPLARQLVAGGVGYMLSYMAVTDIEDPARAWLAMQDQYLALRKPLAYDDDGHLRFSRDDGGVLEAKLAAKKRLYAGFTMASA